MQYDLYPRKLINGRPAEFWLKNAVVVENFIKANNLKPIQPEFLAAELMVASAAEELARVEPTTTTKKVAAILKPKPFPGGIRIPHLHFREDFYLLNDKQWRELSTSIMKGFHEKLAAAGTVNFEQMIGLSDAIDTLG